MDPTGVVMGAVGLVMASQRAWQAGHLAALPLTSAACVIAVVGATASVVAIALAEAFGMSGIAAVVS